MKSKWTILVYTIVQYLSVIAWGNSNNKPQRSSHEENI